jgi:hypothetical protein
MHHRHVPAWVIEELLEQEHRKLRPWLSAVAIVLGAMSLFMFLILISRSI